MNFINRFIKKLYNKWSPTTKLFFWIGIFGALAGLGGIYLFFQTNVSGEKILNEVIATKQICKEGIKNCEVEIVREVVYVASDKLEGTCPYTLFGNDLNFTLKEGSFSFWVKLERLDASFFLREDILFGNITRGVVGKIGNGFRYQGLRNVESEKRYVVEYVDYFDQTFLEIAIINNQIINFRIFGKGRKEFSISHDAEELLNGWVHIVASWGNEINLYVNGQESKNKIIIADANFDIPLKNYYFGSSSKKKDCLNGLLDEVGIWSRELDNLSIKKLYNGGKGCTYEDPSCWS